MTDINSNDCTAKCTAVPAATLDVEKQLFVLSPRFGFSGKPFWTRYKGPKEGVTGTGTGPVEYLYYIESSMLSAW
jgi:hypothetical protein